jgi:MYXO-CTERM domain-containing protein
VTPLVPAGEACGNDYECLTGWCKPPVAPATGDGVCTAPASGMSCSEVSCGLALACDGVGTSDRADDVCVQPADNGAVCTGGAQCKSGNCTTSGGSGMTCAAATGAMCFYGSGCSAGGDGRPGPVTVLLLAAFVAVTLLRTRRQKNRS